MTIPERITFLCKFYGVAVSKLEKDCGFSRGYVSRATNPTIDSVVKVAEYFNMSVEDLCGIKKASAETDAGAHAELIALYNGLNESDKSLALDLLRAMLKNRKKAD